MAFKNKVQSLIDVGWLTFQKDGPNVRTNPLASHGGSAVNAVFSKLFFSPFLKKLKPLYLTFKDKVIYSNVQIIKQVPNDIMHEKQR